MATKTSILQVGEARVSKHYIIVILLTTSKLIEQITGSEGMVDREG
jgi:hypothetical protein